MKKLKLILAAVAMIATSAAYSQTTVTMGAGYTDDVYYSMKNGITGIAPRAEWDLGFYTNILSAGIIVNDGSGIELKLYPKADTSGWMSIDTNGMSEWPVLYNGEDSWENGAFNRHGSGMLDYGWGVYNMQSHEVLGDSLYIIKLQDGTYKKLWIVRKVSVENKYVIRYADLDNSHDKVRELMNNNFTDYNFAYFDFADESFFDREPPKEDWDIVFTKYQALQPQGVYYPVVGVFNNVNVPANRFHPVTLDFTDWFSQPFDSAKVVIGYDWKYFDLSAFQWNLEDSLVFFINDREGDIYKLFFTYFAGTTSGEIQFDDEVISVLDLDEPLADDIKLMLAPNPAGSFVRLSWSRDLGSEISVRVYDLSGKEVLSQEISNGGQTSTRLDIGALKEGMYLVSLISGDRVINEKLLVE